MYISTYKREQLIEFINLQNFSVKKCQILSNWRDFNRKNILVDQHVNH